MKETGMALLAVVGAIALIPVMIVVKAFIVVSIWAWFMVPFGAPMLSIPTAIGVMCVAHYFNGHGYSEEPWKVWIGYLLTWLIAWIVHSYA